MPLNRVGYEDAHAHGYEDEDEDEDEDVHEDECTRGRSCYCSPTIRPPLVLVRCR